MSADGSPQSPFRQILPKCKLARDLKEAYDRCVSTQFLFCFVNSFSLFLTMHHEYYLYTVADFDVDVSSAFVQLVWCDYILTTGWR